MSIILQLKTVATSLMGSVFRTTLIADMTTIENTLNLHQTVLDASNQMALDALSATSASSVAIGAGTKNFTITTGKQFLGGMYVILADAAAPSTNAMVGQVTSYNPTTGALVVEVLYVRGSGTIASWLISLSAPVPDIAAEVHGATNKTTPVGADEVGIWDSVSGLLNRVSFTNLLNWFAAKLGNSANVFSVSAATAAANALRLDQQQSPFRNAAINGDMSISQVNGTTLVTTGVGADTYVIDQHIIRATGAAVTAGQSTDATGCPTGFGTNLKVSGAASNTNVTHKHRIEAKDARRFAGKRIAISVWLYQDSGAAMASATMKAFCPTTTADVFSALTQEDSTQTFSIANAGAITKYTQFITLGASNVARGLEIDIDLNAALLAGKTGYLAGYQIEAVPSDAAVGTEFECVPYAAQLQRCVPFLRFAGSRAGFASGTSNYVSFETLYPPMRAAPTATVNGAITVTNGTKTQTQTGAGGSINGSSGPEYISFNFSNFAATLTANETLFCSTPKALILVAQL